jgi:hypothetical protein
MCNNFTLAIDKFCFPVTIFSSSRTQHFRKLALLVVTFFDVDA